MLDHGVTFNLGSAKVCSHAIFETDFSYHRYNGLVQIIVMLFYLIVLPPFTALLQLRNFTAS